MPLFRPVVSRGSLALGGVIIENFEVVLGELSEGLSMLQISADNDVDVVISRLSDGGEWLLLREDVQLDGNVHKAGTPITKVSNRWFIGGSDEPLSEDLDALVCRAEYGGLSLHVVSCTAPGVVSHRRVGSDEPPEFISMSQIVSPPEPGRDKVYLAFGEQFYPLEYFGW